MTIVNVDQLHRDAKDANDKGKELMSVPPKTVITLIERLDIAEGRKETKTKMSDNGVDTKVERK